MPSESTTPIAELTDSPEIKAELQLMFSHTAKKVWEETDGLDDEETPDALRIEVHPVDD